MLIILIIAILIGGIMIIVNMMAFREVHIYSIIIGFFPLVTIVLDNFYNKIKKSDKNNNIITFSLVLIVIICTFGNYYVTNFIDKLGIVTDVSSYNRLLESKNYPKNEEIYYFPKEIPSSAKGVRLKDWTFIKEGHNGTYLSYYCVDIYEEEEKLKEVKKNTKYIYTGLEEINNITEELVVPEEVLNWLHKNPKDIIKLILVDTAEVVDINEYYSYGIAINYSTYEILYFSEND